MSTAIRQPRFDPPVKSTPPTVESPSESPSEPLGMRPAPSLMRLLRQLTGSRKVVMGVLLAAGGLLVIAVVTTLMGSFGGPDQALVLYTVKRGDLEIIVTERGSLESQQNLKVRCEVDDIEGDSIRGTPILWIVENGANVEKDDLLVELSVANHQNRLDSQILNTNNARSEQIQAKAIFDNQITLNKTAEANAQLGVELAKLEQEMFVDEKRGTHQLEVEAIERLIDDANNQILQAQANLALKKNEKRGVESLFKLGYAGKSEFDRVRLDFLQAENQYAAQRNKLKTQISMLEKKETYEKQMQLLTLQGGLATAQRKLLQVRRDNEAFLAQAKAASEAADAALDKHQERLVWYRDQVLRCNIYAPTGGMVAYAVSDSPWHKPEELREGVAVRPRQHILSLPDLSQMQVKTSVHESVLDQIKAGLLVTVRIDAFPDRSYEGSVKTVAVLADQGSETKVYATTITIDEEVKRLKPGMTAVVEIHVERLEDVLSVPVQAIEQVGRDNWLYVQSGRNVERRTVKLGRTNDRFVVVIEGIDEGDRVVLNPMAIVDETRNSVEESTEQTAAEKSKKRTARPTKTAPAKKRPTTDTKTQRRRRDPSSASRPRPTRPVESPRGGRSYRGR